jgi:hypothetical protein
MPLGVRPADIEDETLRGIMEDADADFAAGRNRACVERCADAYLQSLRRYPRIAAGLQEMLADPRIQAGIEARIVRVAPFVWPRFAAKLEMSGLEPRIVFERERLSFSETVEYYEFTLNLITEAERVERESATNAEERQA